MLSRIAPIVARTTAARSLAAPTSVRAFASVTTAADAVKLSGYSNIEFRIKEDAMVFEAVQQFAANNIGCLVTVNDSGTWQAESTGCLVGLRQVRDINFSSSRWMTTNFSKPNIALTRLVTLACSLRISISLVI